MSAAPVYASSVASAPITQLDAPVKVPTQSNSSLSPDSTSPPGSFWNLINNPYSGQFSDVRTGIYTNYYFSPSSSGDLYLDQTVSGTTGQDFVVELLDQTNGGAIAYSNVIMDNSSTTVTWPNLNKSHHYEVWWAPVNSNDPILGAFEVYQ